MKGRTLLLAVLFVAALASPAPGQFFKKKPAEKPNPAEKLAQLITTLKTDQDETKRENAAIELRHFDPKTYPEVIPVLIECLQSDPKPAVRMEAAQSLGRIRPISQQAGWALEQAASKDSSTRVRLQARSSLWYYRLNGYRSEGKPDETPTASQNPPKQEQPSKSLLPSFPNLIPSFGKGSRPSTPPGTPSGETPPPPLAAPNKDKDKKSDRGLELIPPER